MFLLLAVSLLLLARAAAAVPVGETVRVVAVHGRKLDVDPVPGDASKLS